MKEKDAQLISKAKSFAYIKHKGQKDDSGEEYYWAHLQPVGAGVATLTDSAKVIVAAFLHDTLEDTNTTYEEIVKEFGKEVADLVNEVTHEGKKDGYGYYFPRLKTRWGIMIKLIDRASNVSRMDAWDEDRQKQYLKRTKFWKDGSDK